MTEKPILFSGPMVKAIIDSRKTMTRRVLKPQPIWSDGGSINDGGGQMDYIEPHWAREPKLAYAPGDLLWVRESFIPDPSLDDDAWDDAPMSATEWDGCGRRVADVPLTLRTPENVIYKADPEYARNQDWLWRPSIHMPRWASRITLRVTAVKVDRLQGISGADAVREGVSIPAHLPQDGADLDHARCQFMALWNSLHGPGAWDANPWVAAYSFERVKP